jgi:3'-phosphoadenosine 5'-phosphosulfate sulfotransferase (PAPS reductase)/FAD synthetase
VPAKTDQTYGIPRDPSLDLTAAEVARLVRPAREARLDALLAESHRILDAAIDELIVKRGRDYLGTALLFSGGNDSTTLAHAFRDRVDLAIHANTGIGIEETREFVRATCAAWGLPLWERRAPVSYLDLVVERGFPGPGQHFKMYQRLKERAILSVRADLVPASRSRRDAVIYLAGRRKDESARRSNVPLWEREGSIVWVSPFAYWTKLDLNTYRARAGDVPVNRASELIHMSGECLCGSFAKRGELDEIAAWFPATAAEIRALEEVVHAGCRECNGGHVPHERARWGWGADRDRSKAVEELAAAGALCVSCA